MPRTNRPLFGTIGSQPSPNNQTYQYTMRTDGRRPQTAEQFKNVIIRTNPDGTMVRVGDIADVSLGSKDYSVTSESGRRQGSRLHD